MIGKLVFKLPEEREDFEMAQKGWEYRIVLSDVMDELRKRYKYMDHETIKIDELRELISTMLNDRNLEL